MEELIMKLGVLSDTHGVKTEIVSQVVDKLKKVDLIIHCGDIEIQHLDAELFNNLPVICALTEEQCFWENEELKPKFNEPTNWIFTVPGKRIINYQGLVMYVGHKRSYDFLISSEEKLINFLRESRKNHDNLRWVFCGHTHQQFFVEATRINKIINPGAVSQGFDGYEFAIIDTATKEVFFSRILRTKPNVPNFSVGIISDSEKIAKKDPCFWRMFAQEMKKRNVTSIIHCGNIDVEDIGIPELAEFSVYFNLIDDQVLKKIKEIPPNWHLVQKDSLVKINGYTFYVEWNLGLNLLKKSEIEMNQYCLSLKEKNPGLDFVLCGLTNNALLMEGEPIKILNPGDIIHDRGFSVITLPGYKITMGNIPYSF